MSENRNREHEQTVATVPQPAFLHRPKLRSAWGAILFAIAAAALLGVPRATADELSDARSLDREGKSAEAVAAYERWLSANEGASDWGSVLLRTADLVASPEEEVALLTKWLPAAADPSVRHGILLRLAQTDELLGRLDKAQVYYEEASLVPGIRDYRSLLSSASLLLELGLTAKASGQCRAVLQLSDDPSLHVESHILLAQIAAAGDQREKAGDQIRALLSGSDLVRLTPGDLLRLWRIASSAGMTELAQTCADLLSVRYPASPEAALADHRAASYPTPSQYFGSLEPNSTPAQSASEAPPGPTPQPVAGSPTPSGSQAGSLVIQVGSYLDRDNAAYRLRDLTGSGFRGEIRATEVGGKRYYRVVVVDVPQGGSAELMARLRQKGFDGFVSHE